MWNTEKVITYTDLLKLWISQKSNLFRVCIDIVMSNICLFSFLFNDFDLVFDCVDP